MNNGQITPGTNKYSFSQAKSEAIGGRALPAIDNAATNDGLAFSQAKIEAIGGRALPKPDQGASTLDGNNNSLNVDTQGKFSN